MLQQEDEIRAYLDWPPSVNHYYTVSRGRKILSSRGRKYKADQAILLRLQQVPVLKAGRVHLEIEATPPDGRRRDLDNILKPILDTLVEYGTIADDSAIDYLSIRRLEPLRMGVIQVLIRRVVDGR